MFKEPQLPQHHANKNRQPYEEQRIQNFLKDQQNIYHKFEVYLDKPHSSHANIYVPQDEVVGEGMDGNRQFYEKVVSNALRDNGVIFGHLPAVANYVFVDTTEEYNRYFGKEYKKRGDRIKGSADGVNAICMTPKSYHTETNFDNSNSEHISPAKHLEELLLHETAHMCIEDKYGKILANNLPGWVKEGVPMVIGHVPVTNPYTKEWMSRLSAFLTSYPETPPPNNILDAPTPDGRAPHSYNFGQEFLTWLICLNRKNIEDGTRKQLLDRFISNGVTGNYFDPDRAMQKTFFMSYKNAYKQFRQYLMHK